MYADDNNDSLPSAFEWDQQLARYMRVPAPYNCPDVKYWQYNPRTRFLPGELMAGYALNSLLAGYPKAEARSSPQPLSLSAVRFPTTTVAFCEAGYGRPVTFQPDLPEVGGARMEQGALRHRGGANYAFLDGHVNWHRPEDVLSGLSEQPPDGSKPSFLPYWPVRIQ
jgi:prepilin-type processing-associated H-X9-DG protein